MCLSLFRTRAHFSRLDSNAVSLPRAKNKVEVLIKLQCFSTLDTYICIYAKALSICYI